MALPVVARALGAGDHGSARGEEWDAGYFEFGHVEFTRLAGISVSHIYRLRKCRSYLLRKTTLTKTKSASVAIGEAPMRAAD